MFIAIFIQLYTILSVDNKRSVPTKLKWKNGTSTLLRFEKHWVYNHDTSFFLAIPQRSNGFLFYLYNLK